jgi:hypothetical protein
METSYIKKIFFFGFLICFAAGCTAGSARYPEPVDLTYKPRSVYEITFDELWEIVTEVLRQQNIDTLRYSKAKGRILTHHIVGETNVYPGLFSGIATATRYRYDINLEKINPNQTSLIIRVKIEARSSMQADSGWHDISEDNRDISNQLENWLYEKFENY